MCAQTLNSWTKEAASCSHSALSPISPATNQSPPTGSSIISIQYQKKNHPNPLKQNPRKVLEREIWGNWQWKHTSISGKATTSPVIGSLLALDIHRALIDPHNRRRWPNSYRLAVDLSIDNLDIRDPGGRGRIWANDTFSDLWSADLNRAPKKIYSFGRRARLNWKASLMGTSHHTQILGSFQQPVPLKTTSIIKGTSRWKYNVEHKMKCPRHGRQKTTTRRCEKNIRESSTTSDLESKTAVILVYALNAVPW